MIEEYVLTINAINRESNMRVSNKEFMNCCFIWNGNRSLVTGTNFEQQV
jgi:hypothetical protein